jgi:hypothetical protein
MVVECACVQLMGCDRRYLEDNGYKRTEAALLEYSEWSDRGRGTRVEFRGHRSAGIAGTLGKRILPRASGGLSVEQILAN